MKHKLLLITLQIAAVIFSIGKSYAQTQNLKGIITDKASEKPLAGASISIVGTTNTTVSDDDGRFILQQVSAGRYMVAVSYEGYKGTVIPEVLVTTGKEIVLDIALEEDFNELDNITVKASSKKGRVNNDYAIASARSFNPEEVQRFAGGRNDPSKLVTNFAGVAAGNDSRNDIIVRGNSPTGVLWRLEGLPTPNPNHFNTLGTTGGPVTILNTNAIKQSDFLTSAFPAEFGNATAAAFDISLRSGNSSQHERTIQLNAFSGLELTLEGPLNKKNHGSYLAGYRYSFAQIAQTVGLNIGTDAVPKYQDWFYHIDLGRFGKHRISAYGMGGTSNIDFIGSEIDTTDFYARTDQDSYVSGNMMVFGVKHTFDINSKSFLRTAISYNQTKSNFDAYQYELPVNYQEDRWKVNETRDKTNALNFHSYYNVKQSARLSWRVGVQAQSELINSLYKEREGQGPQAPFNIYRNTDDRFSLLQAYLQSSYKPSRTITLNSGVSVMHITLNGSTLIAPRVAFNFKPTTTNAIYLAYGMHGQTQPAPVYFFETTDSDGKLNRGNRELDFTKAHHMVLGFSQALGTQWKIKAEAYYQLLYDAPVETISSGYSVLNEGANFTFENKGDLVNEGTGSNMGVELTIEKLFSKGWYALGTVSLFDSKYKGSDGIERNTTFNYGQVVNFLAGKEWLVGKTKRNAVTFDTRVATMGGRYQTPVDLVASQAAGREVLDESNYNSERLSGYFRWDAKIGFRTNSKTKKISQTFFLDFQNLTNEQNIFLQRYNPEKRTIGNVYQLGFFPDIMYRLTF